MNNALNLWVLIPTLLLFGAWYDWNSYDYYQILRIVVVVSSAIIVWKEYRIKYEPTIWMWSFVGIALLFQPFFPITLEKEVWLAIDGVVASMFLGWGYYSRQEKLPN